MKKQATPSRRVAPPPNWYETHQISTEKPPADSLFWQLWEASLDIAEEALKTEFIQGIRKGNLDPRHFGAYTVMDGYYCFEGAGDYALAASRANHAQLKAFLEHKASSYQRYNAQFSRDWRISGPACLAPDQAVLDYAALESSVCRQELPIYALIVMLPCEYLWYWLSLQLEAEVSPENLYSFWIQGNLDPKGAYAMGNVIEAFRKTNPGVLEPEKALHFYRGAMEGERNDFAAPYPAA